jgi:hypothetical protein
MKLVQVRECDGKCCEEKPRWPTVDGKRCVHLTAEGRCAIKINPELMPHEPSPCFPNRSAAETFRETCVDWPQNSYEGRDTGGCCWQWVDD